MQFISSTSSRAIFDLLIHNPHGSHQTVIANDHIGNHRLTSVALAQARSARGQFHANDLLIARADQRITQHQCHKPLSVDRRGDRLLLGGLRSVGSDDDAIGRCRTRALPLRFGRYSSRRSVVVSKRFDRRIRSAAARLRSAQELATEKPGGHATCARPEICQQSKQPLRRHTPRLQRSGSASTQRARRDRARRPLPVRSPECGMPPERPARPSDLLRDPQYGHAALAMRCPAASATPATFRSQHTRGHGPISVGSLSP